jgi:hypothetical protein
VVGGLVLPGVGHYDALSAVVGQFLFLLPFFLGRQFLRHAEDSAETLRVLIVAGLIYSLPMLFEIRMSPQLHTWIYGYFPHSFGQQMREGGFRPVVFLGHGLLVAFFIMTAAVAAASFWRTGTRVTNVSAGGVTAYLAGATMWIRPPRSLRRCLGRVGEAGARLQLRSRETDERHQHGAVDEGAERRSILRERVSACARA